MGDVVVDGGVFQPGNYELLIYIRNQAVDSAKYRENIHASYFRSLTPPRLLYQIAVNLVHQPLKVY